MMEKQQAKSEANLKFSLQFIDVGKIYRSEVGFFTMLKRTLKLSSTPYQYTKALENLDLNIEEGDFFAFLGPNGAGKSTAIGIVAGLVNKTSGKVIVNGLDIDKSPYEARTHIGLVPQEFNFSVFEKVINIIHNEGGYYGMQKHLIVSRTQMLLKKLHLWDKRNEKAFELSGGMKRRLMIARGLIHDPKILILDEPTAGVDIEIRREMWEFLLELNKSGKTIILTTHYLEEAEALCKNIAIINDGKIMANEPMKGFLKKLSMQSFVISTDKTTSEIKKVVKEPPFNCEISTSGDVIATVEVSNGLNDVFEWLHTKNIRVMSVRPRVNRLEQLFVNLTHKVQ